MNLYVRIFKFIQSNAHALLTKFEDPVKLLEQAIRDLKKDFDESMKNVAQVKAIAIGVKKDIETKKQIAADYEKKAMLILKKAQNNELDSQEADRLATEALKKKQTALEEIARLKNDEKSYDESLKQMEKKVLELKNQIQKWEAEYQSLKARAIVAKTTKKANQQMSKLNSSSAASMIEEMKERITAEENLAASYAETSLLETNIDDEINKVLGTDLNVQSSLEALKQKLLTDTTYDTQKDNLDNMKKELDS